MKSYTTKIATTLSTLALVAAFSMPANAAVVLGGADGWEVSYGGFINLFYTQSDFAGGEDSAHLQQGLLPAFHTMTVKTPEVNGLTGTGQITFAVDSSSEKGSRLNKSDLFGTESNIDMREVFFNVAGDFGTISVGRTLALFQRQAILQDITLFGMGYLGGPDGGGTGLGRIGAGYVYPDFRTRFVYQTPDMNGFQLSVGIFDPQEPLGSGSQAGSAYGSETDTPQFQAEATFNSAFEGGSFSGWAGFLWQEQEITGSPAGGTGDVESVGWNVGATVSAQGFSMTGSYYDGEALGSVLFNLGGDGFNCNATDCNEADNDGFYVQASYTFNGTTKIGGGYGESTQDADAMYNISATDRELWTVGVYHDVNSWLKVIAEYSNFDAGAGETDTFSLGGFLLW